MANTIRCGSQNETDRQFCVPQTSISGSSTCPPNRLEVIQSNEISNGAGFMNLGRNMSYTMDSSDNTKNPITDIIYAISQPCSNLALDYVARPVPINPLVRDRQACARKYGEIEGHPLFYPTKFGVTELSVYQQNGNLLNDIKSSMKDYIEKDFTKNNYTMFYRTYAKWSFECQNAF